MKIDSLCVACESIFDLASAALSPSYYYDSLPYCIIDAVFSIGVRYTSTQNVVKSYCAYYGLREYNTEQDLNGDAHRPPAVEQRPHLQRRQSRSL